VDVKHFSDKVRKRKEKRNFFSMTRGGMPFAAARDGLVCGIIGGKTDAEPTGGGGLEDW